MLRDYTNHHLHDRRCSGLKEQSNRPKNSPIPQSSPLKLTSELSSSVLPSSDLEYINNHPDLLECYNQLHYFEVRDRLKTKVKRKRAGLDDGEEGHADENEIASDARLIISLILLSDSRPRNQICRLSLPKELSCTTRTASGLQNCVPFLMMSRPLLPIFIISLN